MGDLRLALLYKTVTGHVAINPDQIGLVAADNRTRANHRYKFRAIGACVRACVRACDRGGGVGRWSFHRPRFSCRQ